MNPGLTGSHEGDTYAKGMSQWSETEDATPALSRWQYSLFKPYLGRKLLEIGAGIGRISAVVAAAGAHDELVATEPSPQFITGLRERLKGTAKTLALEATAEALVPQYREHFDTVYSVHVMEHIEHDRPFLEAMLDLTRPGGNVIILVPALPFLYSELDTNIGHYRRYNKKMMRELIQGLPVEIKHLAYNNLLGVAGSFYFSKIRKVNYQKDEASKKQFIGVYRFFSEYVVPGIQLFERFVPVPVGLNLTLVLTKRAS